MTPPRFPPRLRLYYSPKACSLASHLALAESGLDYEAIPVNIRANEHRRPEYLALNPSGTVPALGIDDAILTESQAVLTYIADLAPERRLLPRPGTLARARALEWMNLISSSLHAAFRSIFRAGRLVGDDADAQVAVRRVAHDRLEALLLDIDRRLAGGQHALEEHYTVVDAYLFVFYLWSHDERLERPMPALPAYRSLALQVLGRPTTQKVLERERAIRAYDLPPGFL
ncbi:MAG: glutathione S-transferase N-terminal domain-containing protein [Pigmentiphaga sp.]|nr:glutathione S-transferase N-terminal domain-containing protein [Pigmentiphaga sp.]